MSVCCECCLLSGRGLCGELIPCQEESYRLWCVVMCDLESSWMRGPWPTGGLSRQKKTNKHNLKDNLPFRKYRVKEPIIRYFLEHHVVHKAFNISYCRQWRIFQKTFYFPQVTHSPSWDVNNSVWIRNQPDVTFALSFIFFFTSCSTCFGQPCVNLQELATE